MIKICCTVCDKYKKFKNLKISYIFEKTSGLSIICSKFGNENKKIFKEESNKIFKILGLILNINEYQKMYKHD